MKCKFCDQEASVTFTKIVGDKSKKTHLCAECADERGITNLDNFNLSDMLMDEEPIVPTTATVNVNHNKCDQCGFTLEDLRKIGRLGCSSCYEVFGGEVTSMISTMHKGTEHKGKVPEGMLKEIEAKTNLEELQSQLDKAVADEEYEKAAVIKKELEAYQESLTMKA